MCVCICVCVCVCVCVLCVCVCVCVCIWRGEEGALGEGERGRDTLLKTEDGPYKNDHYNVISSITCVLEHAHKHHLIHDATHPSTRKDAWQNGAND